MPARKTTKEDRPMPNMTQKGFSEIVAGGDIDNPATKMATGGYIVASYNENANKNPAPALLVNSPEFSGGLTTIPAIQQGIETGFAKEKAASNAIDVLFDNTHIPAGYNRSSYLDQIKRLPKNFLSGAAEELGKLVLAPGNAISAMGEGIIEKRFKNTVADAYDKDPELKEKMQSLVYTMGKDKQIKRNISEMTQHDISVSKLSNWKNADGSELTEEQQKLMTQYVRLNQKRGEDERRRQMVNLFGENMQDWVYSNVDTLGDVEAGPGKYGTMVGGLATSALVFGYGGVAVGGASKLGAIGLASKAAKGAGIMKRAGFARWAATHPINAAGIKFAAKTAKPLASVLSGINGTQFVFGLSFSRQYNEIRAQALAAGWSIEDANSIGFVAGLIEAGLEVPTFRTASKYLSTNPSFMNLLLLEVIPEGLQEGAQTFSENMVTNAYGLTSKQLSDIASEVVMASMMGGLGGLAMGSIHYKSVQQEAAQEKLKDQFLSEYRKGASDILKRKNPFGGGADGNFENTIKQPFTKEQANLNNKIQPQNADQKALVANTMPENAVFDKVDEQGNVHYITGNIMDVETSTPVGVYGIIVSPEGKEVGQYEQQVFDTNKRISSSDAAMVEAQAVENALERAKDYYTNRVKAVNPKITDKQIEAGWKAVRRVSLYESNTSQFANALNEAVSGMLSVVDGQDQRFKANVEGLRNFIDGNGIIEDLTKFNSEDVAERHEAQWNYVEKSIQQLFASNGMPKQGDLVSKAFRKTFQDAILFDSNIDPLDFYSSVKPTIVSMQRARRNNQSIAGVDNILDPVLDRTAEVEDVESAKRMAYNLIENFARYTDKNTSSEEKDKLAVSIQQTLFGKTTKADVDDVFSALRNEADAEAVIAGAMGIDVGNDFGYTEYLAMAIMRQMGFNQKDINEAFGVEQENSNRRYKEALQKVMPALSESELNSLQNMLNTGKEEYLTDDEAAAIAGMYSRKMQEIAVLGGNELTGIHEGMHWIFDIVNQLGSDGDLAIRMVKDISARQAERQDIIESPIRLPINTMTSLNTALHNAIETRNGSAVEITPRMLQETFVDSFFNWLINAESVNPELSNVFNEIMSRANVVYTPSPESLINSGALSKHRQQKLRGAIEDMFSTTAAQRARAAADMVTKAIYSGTKTKQELGQALLDAYNYAGGATPFELATPLLINEYINNPEATYWHMMDLAYRLRDNMNQHSLALAFANTESKLTPNLETGKLSAEDNPANFSSREGYGDEDTVLFDRKGNKLKPELARQGKSMARKAKETVKMAGPDSIKRAWNKISQSIASAARALGNEMNSVIQRSGYDHAMRVVFAEDLLFAADDLIKSAGITAEAYYDLRVACCNDNRLYALKWVNENFTDAKNAQRMQSLLRQYFNAIDWIGHEMNKKGVKLAKRNNYIPRSVEFEEELMNELRHPVDDKLAKKIRQMKKDGKTEPEIIDELNTMFRKTQGDQKTEMFHHRVFSNVAPELVKYYRDPFETMTDYLKSASATLMMRELTGDLQVNPETGKVEWGNTGRVGSMILAYESGKLGKYDPKAMDNFVERMKQLQDLSENDDDFWMFIKNTQGLFSLNSVTSTLAQLYELVPALYRYNLGSVGDAMTQVLGNKNAVNLFQVGISGINEVQRLDDIGFFREFQNIILKATGFTKMDSFMKSVVLNSIFINAQRTLGNPEASVEAKEALKESLDEVFPPSMFNESQRKQIENDILNNNITDDVAMWLRSQLSKTQPLDSIAAPAGLASAGSLGKLMYFLSTTQMTQANFIVGDWVKTAKTKGKGAVAKKVAKFLLFALIVGIPVEALVAMVCLRKPDIGNAAVYSPLQFFMINEYLVARAKRDGVGSAISNQFAPGFALADRVSKGQWQKLLPVAPQAYYNMGEKGQKQINRFNENLVPKAEEDIDFLHDKQWFGGDGWL